MGLTKPTAPPRAAYTRRDRGQTLSDPHDSTRQLFVLRSALSLLAQDAPAELNIDA